MAKKDVTLGIDIGGTNTALAFIDDDGHFILEASFHTRAYELVDEFISKLVMTIDEQYAKISQKYIWRGIGIAAPNVNYLKGIIEAPANLNWSEVDLVKVLRQHYEVPVAIMNDANAAALGEMVYGAAKGMKNFILISLGTGLGSGIVINGKILNGANGFAGELGHTTAFSDGRQCSCGKRGCLETYVSANGIRRTALEFMSAKIIESELYEINLKDLNAKRIAEAAARNDPLALAVYEYSGKVLGNNLADVVACLDPEAVILFGGLVKAGQLLLEPTQRHFEASLLSTYKGKVRILPAHVPGGRSGVLGASLLLCKQYAFGDPFND